MFMHTPVKSSRDKMQTDWDAGYLVGIDPVTDEHFIAKEDGVFTCATIRRLPDDEAFDPAILIGAKVRYQKYALEGASSTPAAIQQPLEHQEMIQKHCPGVPRMI